MPANKGVPPSAGEGAGAGAGGEVDRRRRALIESYVGRKVSVSTSDLHHVVGRLVEIDQDDRLRILVDNQEVHVRRQGVVRIHEADPALAEYLK